MALAQTRKIDAVLVTELSRWGRSTQDLLDTLNQLAGWNVSVVAMSGMTFELASPHGRMMATMLAGIAQIEEGRSYRWIARDLGISKNTVLAIAKRQPKATAS